MMATLNKYETMIVREMTKDLNMILKDTIWKVSFNKSYNHTWHLLVHRSNKGQASISTFALQKTLSPRSIVESTDGDLMKYRQNIIADVLNPSQPWHKESTK